MRRAFVLYTHTLPTRQADRIRLYPTSDAARAEAGDGRPILLVALRFDALDRRVNPLWTDPQSFDPTWTAPAEFHADGSITAKGPIPESLFVA